MTSRDRAIKQLLQPNNIKYYIRSNWVTIYKDTGTLSVVFLTKFRLSLAKSHLGWMLGYTRHVRSGDLVLIENDAKMHYNRKWISQDDV